MANLKVSIVHRVPCVTKTGKEGRTWVEASKGDAPLYTLHYEGSQPKYTRCPDNWDDACIAKMRLEKRLRILSVGGTPPEEAPQPTKSHRLTDCINSYIAFISKPDRNGDVRSEKSINSTKSELTKFHTWSGKTYIEELSRPLLEKWRDELNEKYEPDTLLCKTEASPRIAHAITTVPPIHTT